MSVPSRAATRRQVGWAFVAAACGWVVYVVVVTVLAADYEAELVEAAHDLDTAVNRLPADVLAEITQDHPWSALTSLFLLLVPALLILATRRAALVTGERAGVLLAWLGAVVLWVYLLITFGLFADPQELPPLTRDLDVLTVPFVSAGSVLSLLAFVVSAWSLHRHGWRRVASAVAALVAAVLLALGVVTAVASGWDEPVAPVGLLPAELVLGIALLVRGGGAGRVAQP